MLGVVVEWVDGAFTRAPITESTFMRKPFLQRVKDELVIWYAVAYVAAAVVIPPMPFTPGWRQRLTRSIRAEASRLRERMIAAAGESQPVASPI